MQDSSTKKPENTQISDDNDDNSDNFVVPVNTPVAQEQKETESDSLKESQKIPEKASTITNEQSISDNVLPQNDTPNDASVENNEEKIETEIITQKLAEETKEIANATNKELEESTQKDLSGANEFLEKSDPEKEKLEQPQVSAPPVDMKNIDIKHEAIKNSQEKIKNSEASPRVIIREKIIEKKLSEEEIKRLYKKILLEHLKNARKKRRVIYENNLKLIEQKNSNEKFTPKSVAKDLKVSRRTASRYLRKLFKQGKIMRFGAGKKLFYQVYAR